MQFLFAWDLQKDTLSSTEDIESVFKLIQQTSPYHDIPPEIMKQAKKRAIVIIRGVQRHLQTIDELIQSRLQEDWTLDRIDWIDKTLLRIGVFEMIFDHIPHTVAINEALNLAKRYCASPANVGFINGVLDKIYQQSSASCKKGEEK